MILLELVRNDPPLWAGTSVVEQVLGLSLQAVKSIPSNKGGSTNKNALETMTSLSTLQSLSLQGNRDPILPAVKMLMFGSEIA